jgi:hypothetical protein
MLQITIIKDTEMLGDVMIYSQIIYIFESY